MRMTGKESANWSDFCQKWGGDMQEIRNQMVYNLKKDKGAFISFGIIILFTAFMLHLALVLAFQVNQAYDKKLDALHTASINICIPEVQNTVQLKEAFQKLDGVNAVESRNAVFLEAVVKDFRGTDFSMHTVFYNIDDTRTMNALEMIKETAIDAEQSIYLPLYVASFGEFKIGEEIVYEINGKADTFCVSGIIEEMQYGNCGKGLMGAYLPKESYEEFAKVHQDNSVVEYSFLTEETAELSFVQNEISDILNERGIVMLSNNDKVSTKETRTMVCHLLILVLIAFAVVILLVSVFLCKFRISNSLEKELVNMGILKAIGYTGNMIIKSMILPYVFVTVLAALVGILGSYGILPMLSQMLTLQSGFSFTLSFDFISLICVEIILVSIVLLFTYAAAKRIKKIQPIHAIRGTVTEKHEKKNHFPLDKTAGNTQLLLIFKQTFVCRKQNILLFLVSFVLTILTTFSGTLFYNVVIEPKNFMSTLSEEMTDVVIYPKEGCQRQLMETLQFDEEVRNVLQYTIEDAKIGDTTVKAFVCEDFSKVSNDLCYSGENPMAEDEIALGSAFEELYQVGDTIKIENGSLSCSYEITGFIQSVNNRGNVCELTIAGYALLYPGNFVSSLYVYLQDDTDAAAFLEGFEAENANQIIRADNAQQMTEIAQEMYLQVSVILISAIFVLTILIMLFILYIVIKSLLVQRKQKLGIYKAMGYSNWQLMLQTAGSFLPVSVIAVLLSSLLGMIYMPCINRLIFQVVGAMQNNMKISLPCLLWFALVQIMIYFIISIGLTLPIKKISAYTLIKE